MPSTALSILIADDDDGDRKHIRRALHQSGIVHDCVETSSIEEALEACERRAFDCAIVDYQMPGRDGLHGIVALHARRSFMPVIMATSHGDEMVATEAMKSGASDYIGKMHISPVSIKRVVENAIEKAALRRKLAEQRDDLEKFAVVLAHDLKAPITSIQGFARFIEHTVGAGAYEPGKIIDYCHRVLAAGRRMDALIDTLHDYTKADAVATFGPVDMGDVVTGALSNLERTIAQRGARITRAALPVVFGNAPQLTQLVQNLIGNGIKYCERTPPILDVSARPHRDDFWLFAVKDNGIGIPEEMYHHVFEPFKRAHGAEKYEGTGLGLATCKKIVERHGGDICCESRPHDGTTFFFTLPEYRGGAAAHDARATG